jgi:hypothetical protein
MLKSRFINIVSSKNHEDITEFTFHENKGG